MWVFVANLLKKYLKIWDLRRSVVQFRRLGRPTDTLKSYFNVNASKNMKLCELELGVICKVGLAHMYSPFEYGDSHR